MNPQRSRLCYDYRNEAVEIEPVFFSPIAPAKARLRASLFYFFPFPVDTKMRMDPSLKKFTIQK